VRSAEGFISAQGTFPALRYGGFAATRGCTPCAASRLSLHTHKNSTPAVGVCTIFAGFIIQAMSKTVGKSSPQTGKWESKEFGASQGRKNHSAVNPAPEKGMEQADQAERRSCLAER